MEHMKFETPDMVSENIDKIASLFPSAITEMRGEDGEIKRGVNFEVLKQLLSRDVVDGDECYEFTWVGKKAAMAEAARPITKTLRPVKADSRDWDTTENLYIEGDNLEVLKILQESYLGKVKMIYIDPPYNTGHDFIYPDSFIMNNDEFNEGSGYFNEDGSVNYKRENSATFGKYHSDWCSMVYSRLLLARNLLAEDGAIFIHIDENEVNTLSMICKEVFGQSNELGTIIWDKRNPKGVVAGVAYQHESILVYCKNIGTFVGVPFLKKKENAEAMIDKVNALIKKYGGVSDTVRNEYKQFLKKNKSVFSGGESAYSSIADNGRIYQPVSMAAPDKPETRSHRPLIHPITGKSCPVPEKGWRFTDKKMDELIALDKIEYGIDETVQPRQRYYLDENMEEAVASLLYYGGSDNAMGLPFDNPKPVYVSQKLISTLCKNGDEIILDFFSGSATTAHAVMQLNAEDGGNRKFIMVQLPEKCDEASEAYKAGYKNICEIGKERIRRAGDKIKSEHPDAKLDTGFRVFRVDESNMEDVYYHPEELTQTMLGGMVSNIKPDRTDLDLLYACLLDWGVEISLSHTQEVIDGCTVHNVDNGALCACFDERVPLSVIDYMAKQQPLRAVFRDSSFAADDSKINVTEIFKNLSPDTKVKVI